MILLKLLLLLNFLLLLKLLLLLTHMFLLTFLLLLRLLKKCRRTWSALSPSGLDINCTDGSGRTGLSLACLGGWPQVVDLLMVRPDLQANTTDMFGASALMHAAGQEQGAGAEVVALLLHRRDVDVDAADSDGRTAEDYAVRAGSGRVVRMIRGARARRMGGRWDEDEEEEEDSNNSTEAEEAEVDDERAVRSGSEACGDEDVNKALVANIKEKIGKLKDNLRIIAARHQKVICSLETETEGKKKLIEEEMQQKLDDLDQELATARRQLEEEQAEEMRGQQQAVARLEKLVEDFDIRRLVRRAGACEELECPVCLDEMRPPVRLQKCPNVESYCLLAV